MTCNANSCGKLPNTKYLFFLNTFIRICKTYVLEIILCLYIDSLQYQKRAKNVEVGLGSRVKKVLPALVKYRKLMAKEHAAVKVGTFYPTILNKFGVFIHEKTVMSIFFNCQLSMLFAYF